MLRATGILESWTGCPQQRHGRGDVSQRSLSDTGVRTAGNEQCQGAKHGQGAPKQGSWPACSKEVTGWTIHTAGETTGSDLASAENSSLLSMGVHQNTGLEAFFLSMQYSLKRSTFTHPTPPHTFSLLS